MMRYYLLLLFIVLLGISWNGLGQSRLPEEGQFCPDFSLEQIEHYRKNSVSLGQLRGTHFILDFWSIGCSSCIEGFKKMNLLQRKHTETLQFFLIGQDHFGRNSPAGTAKTTYEKYRQRWNLELPVTYDSASFRQFNVTSVPTCFWVDDKGVLKAVTTSAELTEDNITSFVSGNPIKRILLENATDLQSFNSRQPLLIGGNGGPDSAFLFRSVLSKWNRQTSTYYQPFITSATNHQGKAFWSGVQKNRVQVNGVTLLELIDLAYGDTLNHTPAFYFSLDAEAKKNHKLSSYEQFWRRPLLELNDSSDFRFEWSTGKGIYSYSLIVPREKASAGFLRNAMQRDLQTYFPFEVSVEKRIMPCWYLDANEGTKAKLETRGGKAYWRNEPADMRLANMPIYQLVRYIFEFNDSQPPIIDRTGISYSIDIELKVPMMEIEDVRKALTQFGLRLERGRKLMNVIVVRD